MTSETTPATAPANLPAIVTGGRAPRFSIIIPAYNVETYLEDTVSSVIEQSSPDWELVVVDDGSTDDTGQIARRLAATDARIRVLTQPNGGCGAASNTAWRAAAGEFICILGADDLYLPGYLEAQSRFIDDNPGYDIYSCNGLKLFSDGRTVPYFSDARHRRETSFVLDDWLESNPIFGLAIFRRSLAERIGGYRAGLRNAEDYDFWLRAMASGARHRHNPAVLAIYRRHSGNKSGNRVAAAEAVVRILENLQAIPELEPSVRAHLGRVLVRRRAAIGRRQLEARMLAGDFTGARKGFWRIRAGFASRPKYALALAAVLVSPRAYARFALTSPD